jgi:hypothetical protein
MQITLCPVIASLRQDLLCLLPFLHHAGVDNGDNIQLK